MNWSRPTVPTCAATVEASHKTIVAGEADAAHTHIIVPPRSITPPPHLCHPLQACLQYRGGRTNWCLGQLPWLGVDMPHIESRPMEGVDTPNLTKIFAWALQPVPMRTPNRSAPSNVPTHTSTYMKSPSQPMTPSIPPPFHDPPPSP